MVTSLLRDQQRVPIAGGQSSTDSTVVLPFLIDSTTGRVLVSTGTPTATTWGSTGNTKTVTDTSVIADSVIVFMWATPPTGLWSVVCAAGSFTITSSDSESASLAFTYKVV